MFSVFKRTDIQICVLDGTFTMDDFPFHAIIFPGNTWRTFKASGISGFKRLLISRIHNNINNKKRKKQQQQKLITQIVQVEFLKFQNQLEKWVNSNSKNKYKRLLKLSGAYQMIFKICYSEDNFEIAFTYRLKRIPPITTDCNVLSFIQYFNVRKI